MIVPSLFSGLILQVCPTHIEDRIADAIRQQQRECLRGELQCIKRYAGAFASILTDMGAQEAIEIVQKAKLLPPMFKNLIKEEVCGRWPKVFPISNWCSYKEVIKQKQSSFLENAVDNVIRGNEMIIATTVGGLAATGISYVSSMNTITAQRRTLDAMWEKVQSLSNALASSGRQFAPRFEDPFTSVVRKVRNEWEHPLLTSTLISQFLDPLLLLPQLFLEITLNDFFW